MLRRVLRHFLGGREHDGDLLAAALAADEERHDGGLLRAMRAAKPFDHLVDGEIGVPPTARIEAECMQAKACIAQLAKRLVPVWKKLLHHEADIGRK